MLVSPSLFSRIYRGGDHYPVGIALPLLSKRAPSAEQATLPRGIGMSVFSAACGQDQIGLNRPSWPSLRLQHLKPSWVILRRSLRCSLGRLSIGTKPLLNFTLIAFSDSRFPLSYVFLWPQLSNLQAWQRLSQI